MVRAVVDTNVFISAALTPRGTPGILLGAAGDAFQLVWSAGIVAECLRVLTYERVTKRLGAAGDEDASRALLTRLSAGAEMVPQDLIPVIRVVDGDPSDDLLIATALAGRASVLVTGDEPVAPWGDGVAALVREAQRWARARARRTAARARG